MSDLAPQVQPRSPARLTSPEPRPPQVPAGVTARQLECLYWVQEGKSATDIGAILAISSRTVEGHLIKVCGHFQVRTRFQAVLIARDLGLLNHPRPVSLPAPTA
jgi:DNA-binding CsgD family transcriptional regulator